MYVDGRVMRMGLMAEWMAFVALAMSSLGMLAETMSL